MFKINHLKINNMERNTTITFEKAREWYNSGNTSLKERALQAFSKEELAAFDFTKIKTFEDALTALEYSENNKEYIRNTINNVFMYSRASAAVCKMSIIRKALNLGKDLNFTKNSGNLDVYYPYNPFITENSTNFKNQLSSGEIEIIGKIKSEGILYNVLSSFICGRGIKGLGCFCYPDGIGIASTGIGIASTDFGFLGCASKEIVKHFSKYFGMLITEAKFGDLPDFEIIESKY